MSPLRVGIAGYGVVGRRRREHIDRHPDLVTVAVCDQKSRDGELVDGIPCFDHYAKLLSHDLDILFVCLTNEVAAEVTIAGLENGLHVFCEKPPGRNVDDIRKVIACEARHPGQKLMYGFNHRYHDSVVEALRIVREGDLGALINLRGVYGKSKIINFESDWRTKREIAGGGILLDQGIHMVDLMRLFAGEFTVISSLISNDHWGHDVEDNAYVMMKSERGAIAMLHSTATQWRHRFNMEMSFENGAVVLSGLLTGSKSYGAETLSVSRKTEHDAGDPPEDVTRFDADPSWEREVAEFADIVRGDKPVTGGSSAEALKTMELVYQIYCADPVWRDKWGLSL